MTPQELFESFLKLNNDDKLYLHDMILEEINNNQSKDDFYVSDIDGY